MPSPITFDDLWRALRSADRSILMLDYDGTLAPFCARREEAVPLPEVPQLLTAIALETPTRVAVVSGRPVGELLRLLGDLPVALVGEHGWETRPPGGPLLKRPLSDRAQRALREAASLASSQGWAPLLELKRTAVVFHTRGLSPGRAAEILPRCEALWQSVAGRSPLRLCPIDGGLELRALGHDKGSAVRELVGEIGDETLCVYLGDDETDEDAFAALPAPRLGVRVGAINRSTFATARLDSPDEVGEFLRQWHASAHAPGPATSAPRRPDTATAPGGEA